MLLTISTTHQPATDLGYLLHKNPARLHTTKISIGSAHVFYPEATAERCTAALMIEADPIALVRRGRERSLADYVSDRPYVASSFMSVAIAQTLNSALNGRSRERPELVEQPIPLIAQVEVLPARGGEELLRRLFEPLGYVVEVERHALDEHFADWGASRYVRLTLRGTVRLQDLLTHLYVLIPVLDDDKHYWVSADEVDKLLRRGDGWLAAHPARELIVERYLRRQAPLTRDALARLVTDTDPDPEDETPADAEEEAVERPLSLNQERIGTVIAALRAGGASSVVDLGCGEGQLLRALLADRSFSRVVGMDVSHRALELAARRLRLERLPERQRERVSLMHGSLMYRDERLAGFDAAAVVEVIEHLEPFRLAAFERVVFEYAAPSTVVVTTPNREYNVRFPDLPAGKFRHRDHRFEWDRAEFHAWTERVSGRFGYGVRHVAVGPDDPEVGPPTQMAVFAR